MKRVSAQGDGPPESPRFDLSGLATHCGVPVTVLRRWVAQGLLDAERGTEASYGFRAVGRVRVLAQLWRGGWTAARIERAWQLARRVVDDAEAALRGLLASLGQRRIVVRTADGRLVEPGGQLLFDFVPAVQLPLPALRSAQDWFSLGVEAEASGRLGEAVRAYERALPSAGAEAHFNLGNCHYGLQQRAQAAEHFAAAAAAAPDYAEAWNNLGIVRGELGDRHGAVVALRRALELVPHYADAHYNLAEALAVLGELDSARRHWRAYLRFDPNSRWADQVRRRLQANGG